MKRKKVFRGLICVFAALLAFFIFGRLIAEDYKNYIDAALGTISSEVVTPEDEDDDTDPADLYTYKSQYKSSDELIAADEALGTRVAEEGTVLLKNDNGALPISKNSKVSLLGIAAYSSILGGNIGSGVGNNSNLGYTKYNFVDGLEGVGVEVNPNLESAFKSLNLSTYWTGMNFAPVASDEVNDQKCNEPSISQLESAQSGCTTNYGDYTDAAFVVLSRANGEGSNMIPGHVDSSDYSQSLTGNPLSLADNEKALIKNAKENADKVIVVLNSNNPLELTELLEEGGDYEADAILWTGTMGYWGFEGVANVIVGDASPSGKTVDTFAVDSGHAPAAINQDIYWYDNYESIGIANGTTYMGYTYNNDNGSAKSIRAVAYEVEAEGIYTGYKYYETRYFDSLVQDGNGDNTGAKSATGALSDATSWNYDDEVCYSFGYGLSYASFTQTLDSVSVDLNSETVTAKVTVTRSSDDSYSGAAKDVVELYVQSPYTDYDVTNKVEKAAIQLLDYGKTRDLKKGESETITLTADMKYMASYDYTNAKTYILDDGDYYFAIGNGAHDALKNVMALQGVSGVSGTASKATTWKNNKLDTSTFATSEDGTKITNELDDADVNYWLPGTCTYLSRSDWDGTWPIEYTDENALSATNEMLPQLRNRTYEPKTNSMITTTWGEENGITLGALKDVEDFDDERWDFLIEEITIDEAIHAVGKGGGTTETLDSISNPRAVQSDGPNGFNGSSIGQNTNTVVSEDGTFIDISNDTNKGYGFGTMCNAPVIAATFSKEVATLVGEHYGEEGLWCGNSIIWGSCGQLHRDAYTGRCMEYYSEDGVLTGLTNQHVVAGSRTKGLINGPKHFAFNNTEYCRFGLSTFFNEQAARENELRGFQGAFEDGGALATMGAFNRVGITFSNAHVGLYQGILRGEWGFKGIVSTDMADHTYYQFPAECIIAGTTMVANSDNTDYWESGNVWNYCETSKIENDSEFLEHLQENMKYQWYAYANSSLMNGVNENSYIVQNMTWWRGLLISGIVVFAVLLAAAVVLYIVFDVRDKRNEGGNKQ